MSRVIKFKAWDTKSNKMYLPDGQLYASWDKNYGTTLCQVVECDGYRNLSEMDYLLLQYSEFNDKNDVEIYAGDVLKSHYNPHPDCNCTCASKIFVVVFDQGRFIAICKDTDSIALLPASWHFQCEIIGNIYQNPDLIKTDA